MRKKRVLPGFGLSLGFTMLYMSLFVLIPLSIVFIQTSQLGWKKFAGVITNERVLHSYQVSFTTSFAAAIVNAIFGLLIAWVLVRYKFPGKRLLDGLIDLPFALPTAVAGITLTTLYAENGWIGKIFSLFHIKVAFTPLGIIVALTFIGLPFVVRMVQPVLQNIDKEVEEAASSLGASARALGEYGSVVFIAGNMPMKTEIAPLMIMTKLEQYDYAGATAVATVMLIISLLFLLLINMIQSWSRRHELKSE